MSDTKHPLEEPLEAEDGTQWFWFPDLGVWNGYMPGEDGHYELTPDEMRRTYPDVVERAESM